MNKQPFSCDARLAFGGKCPRVCSKEAGWGGVIINEMKVRKNIREIVRGGSSDVWLVGPTDIYEVPDAVPPIHAVSSHVATDKDPSKFRSIFSNNLQPIATRGKIARGMLLVDIGCSSERAPPSVSYYNEISSGHICRGC